jgi:hypothetical protein
MVFYCTKRFQLFLRNKNEVNLRLFLTYIRKMPFTVLTYNIDGLSANKAPTERLAAILITLETTVADVILLQEIVASAASRISQWAIEHNYTFHEYHSDAASYHTGILVKTGFMTDIVCESYLFSGSKMGRNLLMVSGLVAEKPYTFATSHFESMPASRQERTHQFGEMLRYVLKSSNIVIFGGDTNIEYDECIMPDKLKTMVGGVTDIETWCPTLNPYYETPFTTLSKCYDRFYWKHGKVIVASVTLVGTQFLPDLQHCASDHYGLLLSVE